MRTAHGIKLHLSRSVKELLLTLVQNPDEVIVDFRGCASEKISLWITGEDVLYTRGCYRFCTVGRYYSKLVDDAHTIAVLLEEHLIHKVSADTLVLCYPLQTLPKGTKVYRLTVSGNIAARDIMSGQL